MANPWELAPATANPWELASSQTDGLIPDETPFKVEPVKRRSFIKGEPVESVDNQYEVSLAEKGVMLDRPGEGPLTLKDYQDLSYYSAGPEYAKNYVGRKVKAALAPTSNYEPSDLVRVQNGKIQYLDVSLDAPRWKEVDTGVLYSFGKPAFWGEMGTDIAATTGGAVVGGLLSPAGSVAGGSAASGANAYAWRRMALMKGLEMGINEGLDKNDIERLALGYGMTTAGTAGLFGSIGAWPRSAMENSLFTRDTASGVVDDLRKNTADANRVVGEVNALRPGADEQFNPTPAQRSDIKEILDLEATLEAGHAAKATQEIAVTIGNRKARDQRVLSQVWDELFPRTETSIADIEDAGLRVRAEAWSVAGKAPEVTAAQSAARARAEATKVLDSIDNSLDYDELLTAVRGVESPNGKISGTKFYELRDKIVATQSALTEETAKLGKNATVEISDKNLLLPKLRALRSRLGQGLQTLNAATGDTTTFRQLDELIGILESNGGQVPFNFVDKVHQDIGRYVGKISAKGGVADPDRAPYAELASILEDAITTSTKTGPVYARDVVETWAKRKEVTALRHDIFDRKAVREALSNAEPDGITGKQIFNSAMAPESARYLESLVDVVKGDNEAMGALRKAALYRYKQAVTNRDGSVNLAKHNDFVNKFRKHLDLLFPDQPRPWTKVGQLEEAALAAEKKAQLLDKANSRAWYQVFGPKYQYNSTELVNRLAKGSMNSSQADYLIAHLRKNDPELLGFIQKEAVNQLRVTLGSSKLPTAESIAKWRNSTRARNFAKLMGSEGEVYLKNLKTLEEAIGLAGRSGSTRGTPAANLLTSTTRAALGPLHRVQRFITAAKQVYQWSNAKDAYAIIADPVRLQRALQYSAMAPSLKSLPAAVAADIGSLAALFAQHEPD